MSRWADDPEAAADALILRGLDDLGLAGRVLLVNQAGSLPARLQARAIAFIVWNRRLIPGFPAASWPPFGPFDLALVRLPKARDEQEMAVHAAASVLRAGARLILYGGNDEGIRSAATMLRELTGAAETVAARGHGRIVAAAVPQDPTTLRSTLAAWRTVSRIEIAGVARDWVTYPGLFAAGRVDEGTALFLTALPPLAAGARVLDYGCGAGVIAAAVTARHPGIALYALDHDAMALEAVRENVPQAHPMLATGIADAGTGYHAVLSNPPLHQGIAEDHALLEWLVADAPSSLVPGGLLQVVVQRRVPLDRMLAQHFGKVSVVAENGRYRIWRAIHA